MYKKVLESIANDIVWRMAELRQIEEASKKLTEDETKILLKSSIPLIYAHWEGFVVASLEYIFEFLNTLDQSDFIFCDNLLTTAYWQNLKSLADSTGFDKYKKNLISIYTMFEKRVKFAKKIDTKSNLNFKVLEEICLKLNLDSSNFKTYEIDLDNLVSRRNSIAHGENAFVFNEYKDIQEYVDLIDSLMIDFYQELIKFLENSRYKKE